MLDKSGQDSRQEGKVLATGIGIVGLQPRVRHSNDAKALPTDATRGKALQLVERHKCGLRQVLPATHLTASVLLGQGYQEARINQSHWRATKLVVFLQRWLEALSSKISPCVLWRQVINGGGGGIIVDHCRRSTPDRSLPGLAGTRELANTSGLRRRILHAARKLSGVLQLLRPNAFFCNLLPPQWTCTVDPGLAGRRVVASSGSGER